MRIIFAASVRPSVRPSVYVALHRFQSVVAFKKKLEIACVTRRQSDTSQIVLITGCLEKNRQIGANGIQTLVYNTAARGAAKILTGYTHSKFKLSVLDFWQKHCLVLSTFGKLITETKMV